MYYLLLLPLYFLMKRKKKIVVKPNTYQIERNLRDIYQIFGETITRNVEQIYRLETANFTSKQFEKTFSAGMEAKTKKFPYGWDSLKNFWEEQPTNKPLGVVRLEENKQTGIKGRKGREMFIEFPNIFSAMFVLALTLQKRGSAGGWFSTEPEKQTYYEKLLSSQRTTLTDKIKTGAA